MYWQIKLTDDTGSYWHCHDRNWSDRADDACRYGSEADAKTMANAIEARMARRAAIHPKVKVVRFKITATTS